MSARDPPNLRRWVEWGVKKAGKQGKQECTLAQFICYLLEESFELAPKTVSGNTIRMARGREFQIVGAATAKLREPKNVRTRGTNNNLESDERKVRDGV